MIVDKPILYSFKRCPYAMRARMAITSANQKMLLREVLLRDKPASMLEASSKGTVPVVVLPSGEIIDESLDVMMWALRKHDPEGWLLPETDMLNDMLDLIAECDGPFKHHLDRFKYATRYEDVDPDTHRIEAGKFLSTLDERLSESEYLFGSKRRLADIAIFPFVRQFAGAAGSWFCEDRFPHLTVWLEGLVSSELFTGIMKKYPQWQQGASELVFPE